MMKMKKDFPNFNEHLRNYLALSLLVFLSILLFSSLFVVFSEEQNLLAKLPIAIYYLGMFVSIMMMIMGIFYYRSLSKKDSK